MDVGRGMTVVGRDLRALFSTNETALDVDEAFVNRQLQWDFAAGLVAEQLRRVAEAGFDVEDFEAPRNNIAVFHGVGGIGKTTLSRALEAALAGMGQRPGQWGEPAWSGDRRVLPVRIDLARSGGADFERVVLTLRLAFAEVGRPLPAFDLALRRYWDNNHPGEPLEEYLRRGGLGGKVGQALPRQMESAAAEVAQALLPIPGVGAAVGAATGSLVRALRERRQAVRALAGCARLPDLLEAEPDVDALSYYPHLLAWELEQLPAKQQVLPVVLLDTFEDIGDRTHRDFERLVQRVVWLMPNAVFLVTGRSRLDWADPALTGQLDYTGPDAWPGLAAPSATPNRPQAPSGRQMLIGDFSPEDCDDYLARRLTAHGQPLIGGPLRAVITARSHGLPLYLDLSVMRFLEIRRTGRTPAAEDFDADFPALIARTLSDLTPDERHVLRAAALLDAFDLDLATQAGGLTHQAPAQRLTERPFVREDPFGIWPYHLHALIRSTIRTADDRTDDRWSPTDWTTAARRAHLALGAQWTAAPAHDRRMLVACLRQGLRLARDFRLDLDWLAAAAWQYVSDSVWEPLAPPNHDGPGQAPLSTPADALVELLAALARRQHEHRAHTAERLGSVAASNLLPPDLEEMAVYYEAKALRDLGRSAESARGMRIVAAGGGRLAPAARRGLAHLARLSGDFPTALDAARTLGWSGRHHRVEGDVLWLQGDMAAAAGAYAAARDEAEQHGVAGERATSQTHRAFVLAFTDPGLAEDEIDLAHQLLTGLDLRATGFVLELAELVRDAGRIPAADFEDRAEVLRTRMRVAGLAATQEPTLDLVVFFQQAVVGAYTAAAATIDRLRALTSGGDYAYYVDIAYFMVDRALNHHSHIRWLGGEAVTRERWHDLVTNRRAWRGGAP